MTTGDKALVILLVILAAVSSFFVMKERFLPGTGTAVTVKLGKKTCGRYPLHIDRVINMEGRLKIEIKNGRVRVAESSCPAQICVSRGWISRPGQVICCVPNSLLVRITGRKSGPDAVSY